MALAEVPLARFAEEPLIPYESDEVTRLIFDGHDAAAFAPVVRSLTVGEFRDWLLGEEASGDAVLGQARARVDTGDGGGGIEADGDSGPHHGGIANSRGDARFRTTVGLAGRPSRRGCSRIIPRTIRRESWRRWSMA